MMLNYIENTRKIGNHDVKISGVLNVLFQETVYSMISEKQQLMKNLQKKENEQLTAVMVSTSQILMVPSKLPVAR